MSLHPTAGLSTVTIGFLETGNIALAVWKGSVRVASGAKVIENLMAGAMLEFAPPQLPGSSGSGGSETGTGTGVGVAGVGCPAQICLNGPISYEGEGKDQKAFITDETTGIKVELVGSKANGVAAGTRYSVAGNVDTKADPADNTGLKIKVTVSKPLAGPAANIWRICGVISEEKGKYYLTWPETGLRFEIKPDKDFKKRLDDWLGSEKTRREKFDANEKADEAKFDATQKKLEDNFNTKEKEREAQFDAAEKKRKEQWPEEQKKLKEQWDKFQKDRPNPKPFVPQEFTPNKFTPRKFTREEYKPKPFPPGKNWCINGTVAPPAGKETHPTMTKPTLVAALDLESDNRFRDALVLATISATAISVTTATIIDSGGNESISPTRP